jgi:hypothetical protein
MTTFSDDKIRIIMSGINKNPFKFDDEKFHILIFKSKKEHPELFSEFNFKTSGTFPYSDLLERILMRGMISGSLHRCEDDMIIMNTCSPEKLRDKYKEISDQDYETLLNIGKTW